jgi:integrase
MTNSTDSLTATGQRPTGLLHRERDRVERRQRPARFRKILRDAGLVDTEWTPRDVRHSFVSLLSDSGVPIEHISRLVGHANTVVTETVYRLQIRPVMQEGATAMDDLFGGARKA